MSRLSEQVRMWVDFPGARMGGSDVPMGRVRVSEQGADGAAAAAGLCCSPDPAPW